MEGKGYSKLFAFAERSEAFPVDVFREGFDLNEFLGALCRESLNEEPAPTETTSTLLSKAVATKNKVQRLLDDFQKWS